jgi:hypothetical protein
MTSQASVEACWFSEDENASPRSALNQDAGENPEDGEEEEVREARLQTLLQHTAELLLENVVLKLEIMTNRYVELETRLSKLETRNAELRVRICQLEKQEHLPEKLAGKVIQSDSR